MINEVRRIFYPLQPSVPFKYPGQYCIRELRGRRALVDIYIYIYMYFRVIYDP